MSELTMVKADWPTAVMWIGVAFAIAWAVRGFFASMAESESAMWKGDGDAE